MAFKTICLGVSARLSHPIRAAGFTLVEYLIGLGVGSLVLLAVANLSLYSGRSFAGLANYADLNASSLLAIDTMTRDIRQAGGLTAFTTNKLELVYGTSGVPLIFVYSPVDRTLIRQQGSERTVLLRDCEYLTFAVYQRTPKPGTYDQYPAATPGTAKVVEVSWICSRTILGARMNTENVQTAKVIIRKN
jgi:hypothetical protein